MLFILIHKINRNSIQVAPDYKCCKLMILPCCPQIKPNTALVPPKTYEICDRAWENVL